MSFLIILGVVLALLFVVSYLSARRFGVLGLALATGAYLSVAWVGDITPVIAQTGIDTVRPPLESLVAAGLTVLPAMIVLMSGPVYRGKGRLWGAILFAMLASVLLLGPMEQALVIEGVGRQVFDALQEYSVFVITICLIIALLDVLGIKTPKLGAKH